MGAILGLAAAALFEYFKLLSPLAFREVPALNIACAAIVAIFALYSTFFWTMRHEEQQQGRYSFVELTLLCGMVVTPGPMILAIAWAVLIGWLAALASPRNNYPLLCLLAGLMIESILGPYVEWPLDLLFGRVLFPYSIVVTILAVTILIVLMTEACAMIRWRVREEEPSGD